MPALRFQGGSRVTSSPPSRTMPAVGSMKPATMRSVVVLPQPEGPSRTRNSPSAMRERDVAHGMEVAVALDEILDVEPRHLRPPAPA